jgi:hypothetical protein
MMDFGDIVFAEACQRNGRLITAEWILLVRLLNLPP